MQNSRPSKPVPHDTVLKLRFTRLAESGLCEGIEPQRYQDELIGLVQRSSGTRNLSSQADFFRALSDLTRLKIVYALLKKEMCSCEVMAALSLSQPDTSHHMSILHRAGIVTRMKRGKWAFYKIHDSSIKKILDALPNGGRELVSTKKSTILFVCVENAGRSQMAEAFAAKYGLTASSAGTLPSQKVNPIVVEAMREKGVDLHSSMPKMLTQEMIREASLVVTMGCSVAEVCPRPMLAQMQKKLVDWHLGDPKGQPIEKVREIRDEIERRVRELSDSLRITGQIF